MSSSALVNILTNHPEDRELVLRALTTKDFDECWLFRTEDIARWRPRLDVVIRGHGITRHAFLFQQLMMIPRSLLFEVKRHHYCHARCFNPWHCEIVHKNKIHKGTLSTYRWEWEFPEIENRQALFLAIAQGKVNGRKQAMTLEEYYKDHATQKEKEKRASKKGPIRRRWRK